MKYLPLFFVVLTLSDCSDPEPLAPVCQLSKVVEDHGGFEVQTVFTYDASGKMEKQVRTRDGVPALEAIYIYNVDGKVEQVNLGSRHLLYHYNSDGKLESLKAYSDADVLEETQTYTWSANKVETTYISPGYPNPLFVTEFEFENDNLVKRTTSYYTGDEPNVLEAVTETSYEDFDAALNAQYIASSSRPGYSGFEPSKNNYRKEISVYKTYEDGVVVEEYSNEITFTYTYSSSNATVSSTMTAGSNVYVTENTYLCN